MFAESETRALGILCGSAIAGTRGWRIVHNEGLHNVMSFLPHTLLKMIELRRMKSAEKLARTEYVVNAC
jgi:hypothetical protein